MKPKLTVCIEIKTLGVMLLLIQSWFDVQRVSHFSREQNYHLYVLLLSNFKHYFSYLYSFYSFLENEMDPIKKFKLR